jgi:hypothetical protein
MTIMEGPLSDEDIDHFIHCGFVRLRKAFPPALADRCRQLLWEQLGIDSED